MVERSGQRPAGRSDLRARRRHRRALGSDRAAHSRGDLAVRRPVTARAIAVSSTPRTESRSNSQYVPLADSIKISRLKIRNLSTQTAPSLGHRLRRMGARYFARRIGAVRRDRDRCGYQRDARAELLTAPTTASGWLLPTCAAAKSRGPAIALNFSAAMARLDNPAALAGAARLSNRTGAALDPCGALQTRVELRRQRRNRNRFLSRPRRKIARKRFPWSPNTAPPTSTRSRAAATRLWDDVLGTVQVTTPDRAMDLMLNRWLLYQTLACRVWARSAFYQASGAYGFRDQLQDVMALMVSRPDITREHLLRAAARQFTDGDVQHWWLPPLGQGVRTRIADDRVWLAFTAACYVEAAGDRGVLDETVAVSRRPRARRRRDGSILFARGRRRKGVALRTLRACARSQPRGRRPRTAVVWIGGLERRHEPGRRSGPRRKYLARLVSLRHALVLRTIGGESRRASSRHGLAPSCGRACRNRWSGKDGTASWYRRAYFDDGTPLGSASSLECRIDSIAQSWGVISGAANPVRAALAMAAVEQYLVRRDDGLVLLFTPPFDHTPLDPGYIKGYPPGIRENGGQYTHAAVWSVIAFAMLGDGDKAAELFSLLNPISHASTRAAVHRYKVEPYVACADVYSMPPHVGRGGWTWYTGSAGWMYRAGLEWMLGFRLRGEKLLIDPCIPKRLARFRDNFQVPLRALRDRGREPARRQPRSHHGGTRRRGTAGGRAAGSARRRRRDASRPRRSWVMETPTQTHFNSALVRTSRPARLYTQALAAGGASFSPPRACFLRRLGQKNLAACHRAMTWGSGS